MIPLQPPKSHPVLRDPTLPYRATKRPKKYNYMPTRPSQLHHKNTSLYSDINFKSQPCIIGSKNRYDKKGRQRMIKYSKTHFEASFDETGSELLENPGKEDNSRDPEVELRTETDNESENEIDDGDEPVDMNDYHSRSVSPNMAPDNEPEDKESLTPEPLVDVVSPSAIAETKKQNCTDTNVLRMKSQQSTYEDDTFITGSRTLPAWTRTERNSGLQRTLQDRFGKRYAITRWKRKKKLPAYDANHFIDLF